MSTRVRSVLALVLACSAAFVGLDCGAAQSKAEGQLAAIMAGCVAAQEVEQGDAGPVVADRAATKAGCEASLRALDRVSGTYVDDAGSGGK